MNTPDIRISEIFGAIDPSEVHYGGWCRMRKDYTEDEAQMAVKVLADQWREVLLKIGEPEKPINCFRGYFVQDKTSNVVFFVAWSTAPVPSQHLPISEGGK